MRKDQTETAKQAVLDIGAMQERGQRVIGKQSVGRNELDFDARLEERTGQHALAESALIPSSVDNKVSPPRFIDVIRNRLNTLRLSWTPLRKDIRLFGNWFEFDMAAVAQKLHQSTIAVELGPDAAVESLRIGRKKHPHKLEAYQTLWRFLYSVGIRKIELDVRLERNQIEDVLILIHAHRRGIVRRLPGKVSRGVPASLLSEEGAHIACTSTFIRDETLTVFYSYCATRFSRTVRWFEKKNRQFHDHRALFHAAPKYALLIGAIAAGPSIAYALSTGNWYLLLLSGFVAAVLIGLIYLFFLTVGSVEYDNEEKAYRLAKAYDKLEAHSNRIQADIDRARLVQERLLPDLSDMPLAGRLDWAASFMPEEDVGGDYFDAHALDENRVAILFTDVSGHGMGAAFITAILKTTFQAWVDNESTLSDLIERLNHNSYRLTPDDSFAAVFVGIYDASKRELCYVNGGHQPEPWRIPGDMEEPISSLSHARTLVIGIKENIEIKASRLTLKPGDAVLFVSDGIVENTDLDGRQYGTGKFEAFLKTQRGIAVKELVGSIVNEMAAFSESAEPSDDRTVLAFQIKA